MAWIEGYGFLSQKEAIQTAIQTPTISSAIVPDGELMAVKERLVAHSYAINSALTSAAMSIFQNFTMGATAPSFSSRWKRSPSDRAE